MGKMFSAGAGAEFDKLELEPEPHKNGPALQHWISVILKTVMQILFVRNEVKENIEILVYNGCQYRQILD
jgi:hypothetical protein